MRNPATALDRLLIEADHALRTVFTLPPASGRPYPVADTEEADLNETDSRHAAGLMRVNNAGEVAAQGLYRGQAASAKAQALQQNMLEAATEENDHLRWCQLRLEELGSQRSLLDPFWYAGAFGIGYLAGKAGDTWSLGFVEETEIQVGKHLESHLQKLPEQDSRSRHILLQMHADELKHARWAHEAGARKLPFTIRHGMKWVSRVMTLGAYRI